MKYLTYTLLTLWAVITIIGCRDEEKIHIPENKPGANMRLIIEPGKTLIRFDSVTTDQFVFNAYSENTDLKLVEFMGYDNGANEESGMERFSIFFNGPGDLHLPQRTYQLEHEQLGLLDIFLVTVAHDERGFLYEAVFNYFVQK